MILADPHTMNLIPLSDAWLKGLAAYGFFERLDNEADWQGWASRATHLIAVSKKSRGPLPNPYGYSEWRPWFEAAKAVLEA